jgi:hypothetical protein
MGVIASAIAKSVVMDVDEIELRGKLQFGW